MALLDITTSLPWSNIPIGIAVGILLFRELVRALKTRDFFGLGYVRQDQTTPSQQSQQSQQSSQNGKSGDRSVEFWAEKMRVIVENAVDTKLQARTDALYRMVENTIGTSVQQTHAGRAQLEKMLDKIIDNENIILRQLYIARRKSEERDEE